ncbi:hypothetical protein ACJIZ3_012965 [Penstemon smallii]|uniref:Amino acid transporter transmembrane domain-containing protein n=1 Tax=Penstemon smallii TaxID=265156 RepID=A0ABD3URQ7_9LAMI
MQGTIWTAVAHIITGVIGSGVLSLAWSMAQLGWIAGPIFMVFFAAVTLISVILVCDCYRYPDPVYGPLRNISYIEAVQTNLGEKKAWICGILMQINFFGTGIAYVMTSAKCMRAIQRSNCYHGYGHDAPCEFGDTWYMLLFGVVQILISQIPDFHSMAWLSVVAAILSLAYSSIGLGLGAAQVIGNGVIEGSTNGISASTAIQKVLLVSQAIGDIAFAYPYAMVVLNIQDTLRSPPSESETMKKASVISIGITTFFYLSCGGFGYAAFGDQTPGNILTGFGYYEPYWLIDFANACIALHLVGGYQVYSQPLFAEVDKWFAEQFTSNTFVNRNFSLRIPFITSLNLNLGRVCFRTAYVGSTTAIAMIFPYFNQVLGVLGAFNFWPLAIYFPVEMCLRQKKIGAWTTKWILLRTFSITQLESMGITEADEIPLLQSLNSHITRTRTGTVWTAVAHIVTGVIGSGVLSLAWSTAQLGWIVGPVSMVCFAGVTLVSVYIVCDCYRYPDPMYGPLRNRSYIEAVQSNLGDKKAWICGLLMQINFYGTGIAYVITSAISMRAIQRSNCYHKYGHEAPCEFGDTLSMLIFGVVQIFISQTPDFHSMAWLSVVAAIMSFTYSSTGLGLGAAQVIGNGVIKGSTSGVSTSSGIQKVWLVSQAIGDIAFAYPYSMIALNIQDTLRSPPPESETMKKASIISIGITTFFYLSCGGFGYAAFGDQTPGNLLTGFYEPYWLIDFANACIVLHLVGGYQVYSQPVFAVVDKWFAEQFTSNTFMNRNYSLKLPFITSLNLNLGRLCFRTAYVGSTTAIAMIFPYFNQVLGVLGAFNFWPLAIYFPVEMCLRQKKIGAWTTKWILLRTFSIVCFILTMFAFVGSIQGLIAANKETCFYNSFILLVAAEENNGTTWTAVAHIVTGVIGSGVLSLAWSMAQLGWIAGPISMVCFAGVTLVSVYIVCDCYRYPHLKYGPLRNRSYFEAVQSNLGEKKAWICGVFMQISFYGNAVAYVITSAISIRAIKRSNCYHEYGHDAACEFGDAWYMLLFGVVQIFISQIPDFHSMAWLSVVAAIMSFAYSFIGLGLGAAQKKPKTNFPSFPCTEILFKIFPGNGVIKGNNGGISTSTGIQKMWLVSQAIGDIAFAYPYSILVLNIQDTLRSPPSESETMKKASVVSMGITTFFYLSCGGFGYAAFGDQTPGNLLTGFHEPFWLIDFANACIVLHLVGGYQVYSQPVFAVVDKWFAPSGTFVNRNYSLKLPFITSLNLNLGRLCFRTAYVGSTTAIAMVFPYFNQVLGVLGAFNFWPLAIYFPVEMCLRQKKIGAWTTKWILLRGFSIVCFILTVFALVGSIRGLIAAKFSYQLYN